LLFARRKRIQEYALANGIEYRNDSSNASSKYTRNYLRQVVLPQLESAGSTDIIASLNDLSSIMRLLDGMIAEEVQMSIGASAFLSGDETHLVDINLLHSKEPYLQEAIVLEILRRLGCEVDDVDEAYLDVTDQVEGSFDKAKDYSQKIKTDVKLQVGISFTIGVGPNKLIAKIACDSQKPDGLTIVKPQEARTFLEPLDVDRLLGIGKKTSVKMAELGIKTIGDLAKYGCPRLVEIFGKSLGIYFHNAANAIDNEPVQEQGEAESISKIGTLKQDTRDLEFILHKTDELTDFVYKEVTEKGLSFKLVSIYAVNVDLTSKSRSITLEQPAKDKETIRRNVRLLFERFLAESVLSVRRVGVRVSGFSKEEPRQKQLTSFFQGTP
jgi:DNA polymerase IV (DinB-like DNA polymerase)